MLMSASKASSTATRICRGTEIMPENARCSHGGNGTISETDTSRTSTTSTTRSTIRRRKTSIIMSIARLVCGVTESHGKTRRQRLHLQLRSGKTHTGKQVGAHGSPHHLINGGDFGVPEGIPQNRREMWTGHPLTVHICAVQFVHKRGAHTTRLAQVTRIAVSFFFCATLGCSLTCHLAKQSLVIWCVHVLSMVVLSRAFLHEHFLLFTCPTYHTHSENTPYIPHISKMLQLTSCAIKNHSGVKTCRVAETRAPQLPHAAPRIPNWLAAPKRWWRGCRNQKERKELWQNQNRRWWTCLQLFRRVSSSSAKDSIASKSLGILRVSGKPVARKRSNSKPDAASSSQGRLKDAYLAGWWTE